MNTITDLIKLMAALRDPETGCPWDLQQDNRSIGRYTLEETYELLHAIECDDTQNLKEELGDLLFHIVFYAQMASEKNQFDFNDVVHGVVQKMIRRHPHVFDEKRDNRLTDAELKAQWQLQKDSDQAGSLRVLDETGLKLPAMMRAQKLQDKAADYHFDWPDAAPVLDKIEEEIGELREAFRNNDQEHIKSEMGDVLFACVNLARHVDVDAESSLRSTNEKFIRRFDYVVEKMNQAGIEFNPQQLEQMEHFWQQSKKVTG